MREGIRDGMREGRDGGGVTLARNISRGDETT